MRDLDRHAHAASALTLVWPSVVARELTVHAAVALAFSIIDSLPPPGAFFFAPGSTDTLN